jgi:hypothetical protein
MAVKDNKATPKPPFRNFAPSLEALRLQTFRNTGPLSSTEQKEKDCHDQEKSVQGTSFEFVFGT